MDHGNKHSDNVSSTIAASGRKPGRRKGSPKPLGSGRKKGTPNKVGREAREMADKYTAKAFDTLARLLDGPDLRVAAMAAQQILDRRYGRPIVPTEVTGKDGAPLLHTPTEVPNLELARRIAFALALAQKEASKNHP